MKLHRKYKPPGLLHNFVFLWFFLILTSAINAQYAPPVGQTGTTAIHRDSSVFIAWAEACEVERGWVNIAIPDSGMVNYGEADAAVGIADPAVVSLGDGGMATLTFEIPIADGPGPDFAIFENSLWDNFLELAFVEVSSDGVNFFRFDAVSLTQTNQQVASFGFLDATLIHNLAGKYRADFGVPFDLAEFNEQPDLDIKHIISVRVIDVVGCIEEAFSTFDAIGNKVNDPWPTPYPSGGFDLDAVGVIHNDENTDLGEQLSKLQFRIFPNPASKIIHIQSEDFIERLFITDSNGSSKQIVIKPGRNFSLDISSFPKGLMMIRCLTKNDFHSFKMIKY